MVTHNGCEATKDEEEGGGGGVKRTHTAVLYYGKWNEITGTNGNGEQLNGSRIMDGRFWTWIWKLFSTARKIGMRMRILRPWCASESECS